VAGSVVTAVVPFFLDFGSSALAQLLLPYVFTILKGRKWYPSAHRDASHLTHALFIMHQSSFGELENTTF
jgi:hypothetical protein